MRVEHIEGNVANLMANKLEHGDVAMIVSGTCANEYIVRRGDFLFSLSSNRYWTRVDGLTDLVIKVVPGTKITIVV